MLWMRICVTVFDSRQLSLGMGFIVEAAAKAAREGRSMPEIIAQMTDLISRTHVFIGRFFYTLPL